MDDLPKAELNSDEDIAYLTKKRDDALKFLNEGIIELKDDYRLERRLDCVLRINRQLKLIQDALAISKMIDNKKK